MCRITVVVGETSVRREHGQSRPARPDLSSSLRYPGLTLDTQACAILASLSSPLFRFMKDTCGPPLSIERTGHSLSLLRPGNRIPRHLVISAISSTELLHMKDETSFSEIVRGFAGRDSRSSTLLDLFRCAHWSCDSIHSFIDLLSTSSHCLRFGIWIAIVILHVLSEPE
jgi:hypothetical protein